MATSIPYNLLFVGDAGVGKTSFLKKHQDLTFAKQYLPTRQLDLVDLYYNVVSHENKETLHFKVVDFPGQDRKADWDVAHLCTDGHKLDGVVIMFDLSSPVSFRNVNEWIKRMRELTEAPILLVGNKTDLVQGRKISPNKIGTFMSSDLYKQNIEHYYEVSALNNFNYEKPFLWFARHFTGDKTLQYA